jgi:hypothetical protein
MVFLALGGQLQPPIVVLVANPSLHLSCSPRPPLFSPLRALPLCGRRRAASPPGSCSWGSRPCLPRMPQLLPSSRSSSCRSVVDQCGQCGPSELDLKLNPTGSEERCFHLPTHSVNTSTHAPALLPSTRSPPLAQVHTTTLAAPLSVLSGCDVASLLRQARQYIKLYNLHSEEGAACTMIQVGASYTQMLSLPRPHHRRHCIHSSHASSCPCCPSSLCTLRESLPCYLNMPAEPRSGDASAASQADRLCAEPPAGSRRRSCRRRCRNCQARMPGCCTRGRKRGNQV